MKMADAKQKRNEQLKRWIGSETDLEPPILKKKKTKVKFDDGAVFLAACSSGDTEEVLRMLDRGADINYANVDGLTALHQACIDDNVDMVTFLVEHGACINQPDNEGWIPLHAAASCGYLDIAEYLISQGANVGVVNSEGETPLDIAEEEAMEELLQNEINRQGVDIESARKEEERIMLRDARQWLNSGQINDVRHTKSGGTALHVAAAKGYTEVLKLLIQAGYDVNIKDYDGWTPLHAAAHWGKEEACRILVEHLCDMDMVNKVGQTAFDVADEDILGYLEELQKKQNLLLSEKKDVKKSPLIETTTTGDNNQSVKPLKSKETLLLEPEKTVPRIETLEPEKVDEEEGEGKKDESSCSSEEEEEEDSESENEADKTKSSVPSTISNSTPAPAPAGITVTSPTTPSNQVTTPTSPTKKVSTPAGKVSPKEEERKDESPASWRLGLRKTGSYGALAEISTTKEAQKEKDTAGVMRSASSPRLSSSLDNKDKEKTRLAYVAPSIPRRHVSTSDIDEKENRASTKVRVASAGSVPTLNCEDLVSLCCVYRSYLTPVRDEESESQRKARSRQARQSRRSTQGVTLTDLQEAEKTIGRSRPTRPREEEKEEKEKQDKEKQEEKKETETKEDDYRSRYRSFEEKYRSSSLASTTTASSTLPSSSSSSSSFLYSTSSLNRKDKEDDAEDKSQPRSIRDRRRPREKRRSTGVSFWTQDVRNFWPLTQTHSRWTLIQKTSWKNDPSSLDRYEPLSSRGIGESRRPYSRFERDDTNDYKKLYEQILAENEKLKAQLRDTELELADLKLQLEKATQVRSCPRFNFLREGMRKNRNSLERKISEMEEELKTLPDLKADNQRLKDENGALIRVISKLSK
uniref:Protein phosphatase 1 regulatory subunit n=1 Tax=Cyprinus carpio carpio TaxID=630221 RepID=A0A9J8B489_CYPCA